MAPVFNFPGLTSVANNLRSAEPIAGISVSSPELDNPFRAIRTSLVRRADSITKENGILDTALVKRAVAKIPPGQGAQAPENVNNKAFFALFALLGVAMVLASLWFFFWAKNGGFKWREGDWEEYKSTVLRRKGPDGKTLSNATKSTKLGGGTIVGTQRYAWEKNLALSVVGRDKKGRKGVMAKRGWAGTHSITYSDDFTDSLGTRTVTDEMTELRSEPDAGHHSRRYRDRDVHQYKREKPARVGGINREPDGSNFDYTNTDRSDVMTETVLTESSDQPILPGKTRDSSKRKERERAERRARDEAARMERRWKREAEEAAAAMARESERIPPPPPSAHKSSRPRDPASSHKPRRDGDRAARSHSPKKRDFSYTNGPESEVLSTAYTASTSQRTASYYDDYRPTGATSSPRYYSTHNQQPKRQSSPQKKQSAPGRSGGYRRGNTDSDLE